MKFFVCCCLVLLTTGLIVARKPAVNGKCRRLLTSAGASSKFAGSVAHAVHSMTVADLKQFYPTATIVNYVPTINKNLTADNAILLNAPENGNEASLFLTDAMNTIDSILSKMDDKRWDIKNYSPLEKLVHAFHMKEVWARALNEFRNIESNPMANVETVCQCAMDVVNNGIMQIMKYLALVIREPSLVYGNPAFKDFNWDGNIYRFNFHKDTPVINLENENGETSMPRLDNAESWKIWKQMVPREDSYNTALFLFCAAKKAENDQYLFN